VEGRDRRRLFCALLLPPEAVRRCAAWQAAELAGGRPVPPEQLHVTLAFLGSRPAAEVPAIGEALRRAAAAAGPLRFRPLGYRETRSGGMLTFSDRGGNGAALAGALGGALEALGVYEPEARPWLPHLTVLRFRQRPRLRPTLPELGELAPSDAAVFMSTLRPGGARYEALETARLGAFPGGR